jgi:hypothetical protein
MSAPWIIVPERPVVEKPASPPAPGPEQSVPNPEPKPAVRRSRKKAPSISKPSDK